MMRLFTSPLKAHEFIIGYTLPLLPMAILQSAVCVVVAFFLGLEVSVNILLMLAVNIPIAIVFISLGLLLGTLLNEKAVGGICGALLTNLSTWFSNIWFDTAIGMFTASIRKMFTLTSSPRKNATTTNTALCKIAIGKSGSV